MNPGFNRALPRLLSPLNLPGSGYFQGMFSKPPQNVGLNVSSVMTDHIHFPSYVTTVRGGVESLFRPTGPMSFPTYANPLWGMVGDKDHQYELHQEIAKVNVDFANNVMGMHGPDLERRDIVHVHSSSPHRATTSTEEDGPLEDQQLDQEGKRKSFPSLVLENVFEPFSNLKDTDEERAPSDQHNVNNLYNHCQDGDKEFMDTAEPDMQNQEQEEARNA
ncbi:hypothetical protein L7F22_054478 [Adiantum nelumboides]|nr:hypothetical protein [Adiantum nelumboides]